MAKSFVFIGSLMLFCFYFGCDLKNTADINDECKYEFYEVYEFISSVRLKS